MSYKNNFGLSNSNSGIFINNIYAFQRTKKDSNIVFSTLEQVYLAFLMQEKYQKIWNKEKEEWIKI